MRKLILIFSLGLLLAVQGKCQVIVLQTTGITIRDYNRTTDTWSDWSEWTPVSIIIKINTDDDIVKIDNAYGDSFKLLSLTKDLEGVDADDDHYKQTEWSAIDKEGIKLTFKIRIYDNDIFHVSAVYSNIWYVYQASMINF